VFVDPFAARRLDSSFHCHDSYVFLVIIRHYRGAKVIKNWELIIKNQDFFARTIFNF
jgi:hypothetical protein